MTDPRSSFDDLFNDPRHAADYADGPARFMPGYFDVQRMASVLIRERISEKASILVHGSGGGLELETFAKQNPGWSFVGVDPAKAMLDAAAARLEPVKDRIHLHHGYINDAPKGPFDAATSLLTLHFLERELRRETISQIRERLKPGAPFIAVHCSFSQVPEEKERVLLRHRACAIAGGVAPDVAEQGRAAIANDMPILDPDTDVRILRDAGFDDVHEFYSAFTWRGWVGYAA
ncbi:MAG: class I SAM-dependent methyltransferase [Pseudomonadota bacterium]